MQYLGLSSTAWSLVFGGASTLTVVFGVAFGISQVQSIRRQRASDSLQRMFESWRAMAGHHRMLNRTMPMPTGDIVDRAHALAVLIVDADAAGGEELRAMSDVLGVAREVIRELNDLGVFVERGIVVQRDFFRNYHQRIVEIVYLLEPLALLVSAASGNRWGFRLKRLRLGAERYNYRSPLDAHRSLNVNGVVVLRGAERRLARTNRIHWNRHPFIPTALTTLEDDERALADLVDRLANDPRVGAENLRAFLAQR